MWRYQAVYVERDDETREYSLCEVYFDEDGKLEGWTEKSSIAPYGTSPDELVGDIKIMLEDAVKWKAVPFDSLCTGMTFTENERFPRISQDKDIMGGKACIKGTRVTVGMILAQLSEGMTHESLIEDYPYLSKEDILEALNYMALVCEARESAKARRSKNSDIGDEKDI